MISGDEVLSDGNEFLIGIRLRLGLPAEDYKLVDLRLHVGDLALVETASGTAIGEARRPQRPLPEFKRDRLYRRVLRAATEHEAREYHDRLERERRAAETCQRIARERGLQMKVIDVEMAAGGRRVTVYFNSEDRVDFRDLVRQLAH